MIQEILSTNSVPIMCHAWNENRSQIAFSTAKDRTVYIYKRINDGDGGTSAASATTTTTTLPAIAKDWQFEHELKGHEIRITSMDWAPKSNRIVTISADRSGYVWSFCAETGKWLPVSVMLRINRAATCVKWSPDEQKFAAGAGDKLVAVCHYDRAYNWWISKHIKKPIKSTVMCLAWHPNSNLIACGCCMAKVRVFSAFIDDGRENGSGGGGDDSMAKLWSCGKSIKQPIGQLLLEANNSENGGGWITCMQFASDGLKLCWVAQNSSINILDVTNESKLLIIRHATPYLPFLECLWISDTDIFVIGYDFFPIVYSYRNGTIDFKTEIKILNKKNVTQFSAMKKFQSLDNKALNDPLDSPSTDSMIHQNEITTIKPFRCAANGSHVTEISSSGLDGKLLVWHLNEIAAVNHLNQLRIE